VQENLLLTDPLNAALLFYHENAPKSTLFFTFFINKSAVRSAMWAYMGLNASMLGEFCIEKRMLPLETSSLLSDMEI